MIIVYNLAGLLIGAGGIAAGMFAFVLAMTIGIPAGYSMGFGALVVAAAWFVGGLAWRFLPSETGTPHAWPALFFIPLPFAAVPLAGVAMLLFALAFVAGRIPVDPRSALLDADEKQLKAFAATGDVELSNRLLSALQDLTAKEGQADKFHIFTRVSDRGVLVLIKMSNLKNYSNAARRELLAMTTEAIQAEPDLNDKPLFIGVKGKLSFGAIQHPPGVAKTDTALSDSPLYDFYGDEPIAPKRAD